MWLSSSWVQYLRKGFIFWCLVSPLELVYHLSMLEGFHHDARLILAHFGGKFAKSAIFGLVRSQKCLFRQKFLRCCRQKFLGWSKSVFGTFTYLWIVHKSKSDVCKSKRQTLAKKGRFWQGSGPKITFFGVIFEENAPNSAPYHPKWRDTVAKASQECSCSILVPYSIYI